MRTPIEYPIRINRYLYLTNICSRRAADKLIERGLIRINGEKAVLGQKVNEGDKVEVTKSVKKMMNNYKYIAFNKPRGVVSHDPQEGEESVEDFIEDEVDPVGRLDKDSEGLMLLTNDGRIVNKILSPEFSHEKEYRVTIDKEMKPSFKKKMQRGVNIEGYITKPAVIKLTGPTTFVIILTEGKKHQIRRMCMNLGYTVTKLYRTRIMDIKIGALPVGEGRNLSEEEKTKLLKSIGLKD
ncbi:MAG: 23S rRNA pseudouridine2604 synthase [Candidatus Paceibacteria bacterium]|jgi:23S rRNA pseudouridine2604 synthase